MKHKSHFTLIELLVSMGLLTLLVMLMLQLFSGAQRLWIVSDRRSTVYADTRAAMELMSDMLSLTHFSYGEKDDGTLDSTKDMVFNINESTTSDNEDNYSIVFAAKTNRSLPRKDSSIRFISFRRGSGDDQSKLYMTVCSDSGSANSPSSDNYEDKFYSLFPPYSLGVGFNPSDRNAAFNRLKSELAPSSDENKYSQIIAENVVGVTFHAYIYQNDGTIIRKASTDITEPPYMIELRLSVLSKDDYDKFKDISDSSAKNTFLLQHKRTFTRNVFLGDRWSLQK